MCIYSTPNIFCQVKRMLYNSIYIYIYICILEPLGLVAQGGNAIFAWVFACCVVLRCAAGGSRRDRTGADLRGRGKEVWWRKKIKQWEGEIMFVSHNLLWMDFSATGMFTEGYCLVRWREGWHRDVEKTELAGFFFLNVEGQRVGVGWGVKYQLGECRNVTYNFAFSRQADS